jgi:hypothetical protein
VALLHKHFECYDDERMIQRRELVDSEDALVTRPVSATPSSAGAVPVVWSLVDDTYHPLEYSADPLACELLGEGQVPQAFLRELSDLLRSSPIGRHVGLAVVKRALSRDSAAPFGALEFSEPHDRTSVVFIRNQDKYKDRMIRTAWDFSNVGGPGCVQTCFIKANGEHGGHHKPGIQSA